MARGAACCGGLPAGFEATAIGEAHEQRVEGSRGDPGFPGELVSMTPPGRIAREELEDGTGLA